MVKMAIFGLIFCQNLRLTISTTKNLDFGYGHGRNFDHLTIVFSKFWPWSWSKIFDHMTMTPARRPYGQKIMVALPPPPSFSRRGHSSRQWEQRSTQVGIISFAVRAESSLFQLIIFLRSHSRIDLQRTIIAHPFQYLPLDK